MTISTKHQSLSNMLRRLLTLLVLGGFVAICLCEPVNRKYLLKDTKTVECTEDNGNDGSACGTNETADVSSETGENQTQINNRQARQELLDNDDVTDQVSARKKGRKGGYGRLILYMLGAMKAAMIYGLLHGIAALAGKAVLLAKIALAVAVAAILKKNDHEKTSYEIVKHPQYSYAQTHSSSVDYDHRSDYGDENIRDYDHRKRRRVIRKK